jgi:hypothetical protein
MRFVRLCGVAVMTLALAACPDNGVDDTEDRTAANDTVAAQPAAEMGIERIDMNPIGESNVSGEASIAPDGQNTQVMVRLMGATQGQKNGHIHTGTCDNLGPVVFELDPIQVQQGGGGTTTSTVNAPIEQVTAGSHVIAYHEAGGQPGRPVVCGEIPQHGTNGR